MPQPERRRGGGAQPAPAAGGEAPQQSTGDMIMQMIKRAMIAMLIMNIVNGSKYIVLACLQP